MGSKAPTLPDFGPTKVQIYDSSSLHRLDVLRDGSAYVSGTEYGLLLLGKDVNNLHLPFAIDNSGNLNVRISQSMTLSTKIVDSGGSTFLSVKAVAGTLPGTGIGVLASDGTNNRLLKVDTSGQLLLGATTNAIGKLAANSGVDIGDVDVTSIAAGTNRIGGVRLADGSDNYIVFGKHGSAVTITSAFAPLLLGYDYSANAYAVKVDSAGLLYVKSVDSLGTVSPGTGAANLGKAEDAGFNIGDVGVAALAVRADIPGTWVTSDHDYTSLTTDKIGQLWTNTESLYQAVTGITKAETETPQDCTVCPKKCFALQVVRTAGSSAWSVTLEGSLDGTNYFLLTGMTHNAVSGSIIWSAANLLPVRYFRINVGTCGSGNTLSVYALGTV